jgi:hypothetical protein
VRIPFDIGMLLFSVFFSNSVALRLCHFQPSVFLRFYLPAYIESVIG